MAKLFERYKWLCDYIQRNGRVTLQQIQNAWDRSPLNEDNKELTERTFYRHKIQVEEQFGITIKCDRSTGRFFIDNEEEISCGGVQDWLLNTIAVDTMLSESKDLRDRIQFEPIPGGQKYLSVIMAAMREGKVLKMKYRSFNSMNEYETTLKPYFLKVFQQRWYVIGLTGDHTEPRTYALDRIQEMVQTEGSFNYPHKFSPEEFYYNCYGIFHSEETPKIIKLKVQNHQSLYFDTLPIHRSQKKIQEESTEEYCVYEYFMSETLDFVQFLCSKGATVEVLEPEDLRQKVKDEIRKMYKTYYE